MIQTTMGFAAAEVAAARQRKLSTARRAALAEIGGGGEFARLVGAPESAISQALNGRHDRPWREDWTVALLSSDDVSDATKRALADALLGGAGLVSAHREEVSVREVAERALVALDRFGAMGAPIADELRGLLLDALAAGRLR